MRIQKCLTGLLIGLPMMAVASLPRVPFSGSFGATEGAGAVVGWERLGFGVNPAAENPHRVGASIAGYSPFGLDGVEVTEAGAFWDRDRFGTSMVYRGFYSEDGGSASAWQLEESARLGFGVAAGLSGRYQNDENGSGFGGGAGVLWNHFSFLTLGALSEITPLFQGHELNSGLGADVGTGFLEGYSWRICAERFYGSIDGSEWRFGAALRLHSLLSVNGGWSPKNQTMALGIRFGMGNWEGFSALRRHAALGTTSVQGLHWTRPLGSRP